MTEKRIKKLRGPYRKFQDGELLPQIKAITDERGTYGYRRVTALLNRIYQRDGKLTVNHKRIYRIMKSHGLLLQKHTGKPTRTHDGKVVSRFFVSRTFDAAA